MSPINANLFEAGFDFIPDLLNQDANADLAGDWVKVANYERAYLLLIKPAGTGGDDLVIHMQQAATAAGGSVKDLIFSKLWYKKATATNDFTAVPLWTEVVLTTPVASLDLVSVNSVDLATDIVGTVIIVEVRADSLDGGNGFKFVNNIIEGDDIGNALILNQHWILWGSRYPQAIPLTAIS